MPTIHDTQDTVTAAGPPTLPTYNYSPLPENHIRVLQLLPNPDANAPVDCALINYPLLDARKGTHLYEAVSYVWGPPPNTHHLLVNGASLSIRQNCHAVLVRLRDPAISRFLWVDAVCINQDDNDEKTDQVQLMTWIYSSARGVLVWLEEPSATWPIPDEETRQEVAQALQVIQAAADDSMPPTSYDVATDKINALSRRSWFRRIWVLQEVAGAKHVSVMCHEDEVDGEVFCKGLEALGVKTGSPLQEKSDTFLHTRTETATPSTKANHGANTWGLVRTAAFLIKDAGLRRKRASGRLKSFSLNIRSLLELIRMYHDRDATDRRDKIFALLGMSSDVPEGIAPDYNVSWSATFRHFTSSIVGSDALIRTEDDHEIALIYTRFHVLGTVSKVSQRSRDVLGNVQEVDVRLAWTRQATTVGFTGTSTHFSHSDLKSGGFFRGMMPTRTATWVIHAPVVSIREGDIVCVLQDTALPTIIRPHHQDRFCVVVALTTTDMGGGLSGLSASGISRRRLPAVEEVPIIWDWGMCDRATDTSEDGVSTRVIPTHVEFVNTVRELPRNLDDLALEIKNWSRLAFQTGNGHLAVQTIEAFLTSAVEVDQGSIFQLLGAIDVFRELYTEVGADFARNHDRKALTWMADKLKHPEGGYIEATEPILFMAILNSTSEGLATLEKLTALARYRGSFLRITTEFLKAAVRNLQEPEITGWALNQLRFQRDPVDVDAAEIVSTAAKARNYKAMAELVVHFGERALVSNAEVAKALWHPKTKGFWPKDPKNWAKLAWMPPAAGSLFDCWRQRISIEAKQSALEDIALHKSPMELLQSYLEAWGHDGQLVTTTMLANAAGRYHEGCTDTFKKLLRRYGDRVPITDEVMREAVLNHGKAPEMVEVLLEYCGDRLAISEEMAIEAVKKPRILGILLNRCAGQFPLSEGVMESAMWDSKVVRMLFERYEEAVPVTEKVLLAAIRRDDTYLEESGVVKLTLDLCDNRAQITEKVMVAAAASDRRGRVLIGDFLHRYGEQAPITGRVLGAAVRTGRLDTVHLLLSEQADRGGKMIVDENTVIRALLGPKKLSPGDAVTILKLFTAQHGNDTVPKQRLMKRVTRTDHWRNAMVLDDLIKADLGHLIPITTELISEVQQEAKKIEAEVLDWEEAGRTWGTVGSFHARRMELSDRISRAEEVHQWLVDEYRRVEEEKDWETEEEMTGAG